MERGGPPLEMLHVKHNLMEAPAHADEPDDAETDEERGDEVPVADDAESQSG